MSQTGGISLSRRPWLRWLWWPLALAGVLLLWQWDAVAGQNLLLEVDRVRLLPWLESPYTYLYLHAFTLVPVLLLSFDRKVHYYTEWKFLLPAIVLVGGLFIAWDVYFTRRGVWGFNERYLSGMYLLNLPVEEWLFFFSVPFACVFIYECLNAYVPRDLLGALEPWLSYGLLVLFLGIGLLRPNHLYTSTTFLLSGAFMGFHLLFVRGMARGRFYMAFLISVLPFLLVNGVLTGGFTEEPVVIYNPDEYLGLRIASIPVDDLVYSFLLLFSCTTLFDFFRGKAYL